MIAQSRQSQTAYQVASPGNGALSTMYPQFHHRNNYMNRARASCVTKCLTSPTAKVAAGAFLISFSPVFVTLADIGPAAVAFYRLLIGGVVLSAIAFAGRRVRRLHAKAMILACTCGLIIALDLSVWHLSIQLIGPGLATILGNHQVFILSAFGVLFLGERITLRLGLAILLAMLGLSLIFGPEWSDYDVRFRFGVLFGFLTALLYGTFLLLLRHVQAGPNAPAPAVTVAILSIIGATVIATYSWIGGESLAIPDGDTLSVLIAYALVSHVIGWILISTGLPDLEASRAGLVLLLQPALAFIWDVLFFGRPTSGVEVLGAVTALAAIYLGTARNAERGTSN
jgi:drug/metabolite transporter (DMT)-like permease